MKTLKTRWTSLVQENPDQVLTEYPRPNLVRESYVNLNGKWEYAFTVANQRPVKFDGEILVPFSPEAPLSGVGRQLRPNEFLWYRRWLPVLPYRESYRWILHFGAVDQFAAVYVNGKQMKKHLGGFLPFSVDVTESLKEGKNELLVAVRDSSEYGYHSRGKQKLKRGGMFYTAQSGIWQTVWMEQVPEHYIRNLIIHTEYDKENVIIRVESDKKKNILLHLSSNEMEEIKYSGMTNEPICIHLAAMHSWSPEDPFLYDLKVIMGEDCVKSYFAMRKIAVEKDEKGIPRTYLNNRPYFQNGILDQGYWPDGLYTAPTDESLIFDIKEMKRLGFNMIRKHIKIEPQRWYYHCDRLGMLVWQDMVCGGRNYKQWFVSYIATAMYWYRISMKDNKYRLLGRQEKKGREQFIAEMKETIALLYNHPSIVTWVIFNEGWGQFDAEKVTEIAREADHTRLLDQASGWFDQKGGDFSSLHEYFRHVKVCPEARATALTEFGGHSFNVPEHSMCEEIYGYHKCESIQELTGDYVKLIEEDIVPNIDKGLCVTVYTQLSDIEEETNGIYTYDREVLKFEEDTLIKCNRMVTEANRVE